MWYYTLFRRNYQIKSPGEEKRGQTYWSFSKSGTILGQESRDITLIEPVQKSRWRLDPSREVKAKTPEKGPPLKRVVFLFSRTSP